MVSEMFIIPMVKLEIHSTIKFNWTMGIIFCESFFYSRLILRELLYFNYSMLPLTTIRLFTGTNYFEGRFNYFGISRATDPCRAGTMSIQ